MFFFFVVVFNERLNSTCWVHKGKGVKLFFRGKKTDNKKAGEN